MYKEKDKVKSLVKFAFRLTHRSSHFQVALETVEERGGGGGNGAENSKEGRRGKCGEWDSQRGGNREKEEDSLQYCVIFYNRKSTMRWGPLRHWQKPGVKGTLYRAWEAQMPLSPPTTKFAGTHL